MSKPMLVWTAVVAAMAGCEPGSQEAPSSQAGERPASSRLRQIATATHESGNSFVLLQAGDASIVVVERGVSGATSVPLPPGEPSPIEVFRHVAPRLPAPDTLVQADRDYRFARERNLLGTTSWLPDVTPSEGARPVETVQQAVEVERVEGLGSAVVIFAETFCIGTRDDRWACDLGQRGMGTYVAASTLFAGRHLTTSSALGTTLVQLTYRTCIFPLGCTERINDAVAEGTWVQIRFIGTVRGVVQETSGSHWHFASTRPFGA